MKDENVTIGLGHCGICKELFLLSALTPCVIAPSQSEKGICQSCLEQAKKRSMKGNTSGS